MAIILVADVPVLAREGRGALSNTDRATYSDVWDAVAAVLYQCVMRGEDQLFVGLNSSTAGRGNAEPVNFRSPTGWRLMVSRPI